MQDSSGPMPFNYTEQETMRALGGHELMEVKKDSGESCVKSEVTRQWAVFPGGSLKEFKPEHDGHTLNREVARSWVGCPGGVLKKVKTEHNE